MRYGDADKVTTTTKEAQVATTSLTLSITDLRAVVPAGGTFRAAALWKDGVRTDETRKRESGQEVHTLRDVQVVIDGNQAVDAVLEGPVPMEVPLGAILSPRGPAELRVRGQSSKGSDFASLVVTIWADGWETTGSIAEALGMGGGAKRSAAPAAQKSA